MSAAAARVLREAAEKLALIDQEAPTGPFTCTESVAGIWLHGPDRDTTIAIVAPDAVALVDLLLTLRPAITRLVGLLQTTADDAEQVTNSHSIEVIELAHAVLGAGQPGRGEDG